MVKRSRGLKRASLTKCCSVVYVHKIISCLVCFSLLVGCGTVNVPKSATPRKVFNEIHSKERIIIIGFQENDGECLREEIKEYLKHSNGFTVVDYPKNLDDRAHEEFLVNNGIGLVLSGNLEGYTANSNGDDRKASIIYFTAFIITAPIALGIYLSTNWEAYGLTSGSMQVTDTSTDLVFSDQKKINARVQTTGKSLASEEEIKEALFPSACKALATNLINNFVDDYRTR